MMKPKQFSEHGQALIMIALAATGNLAVGGLDLSLFRTNEISCQA
jgi:hypothetical protein